MSTENNNNNESTAYRHAIRDFNKTVMLMKALGYSEHELKNEVYRVYHRSVTEHE